MKLAKGIYSRKNTLWLAFQKDGKRTFVSLQTNDTALAITRAEEIKANGVVASAATKVEHASFDDTITSYLASKTHTAKHGKRTGKWARLALKQFSAFVKNKQAKSVTTADVEGFYAMLRKRVKGDGKPMSENSARSYLRAVRAIMAWCVEKRLRLDNPCKVFKLNQASAPARLKFATKVQRDAFIAAAGTDDTIKFILFCAFHAGMRFNEIIQARPNWIHLEDGFISIEKTDTFTPKNKKNRTVPLSKTFKAFLTTFKMPDATFIVEPERTEPGALYRYNFSGIWKQTRETAEAELAKAQGVEKVDLSWLTPHVARHTFASLLAQAGVSIYKIALWLGDTVQVTTAHYAHLAPSDNAIDALV